ncbi:MAG: hypothetical protein HRU29_02915 [Rhizobiales bacterium]|nr:hypothetical protein [Hyphomicrobiales bacterium]NRB13328.1 hypothetical protein [Hyphomicrobiales bacterium]
MSENRTSVESVFAAIITGNVDDVKHMIADNAMVKTVLGREMPIFEWMAYFNKLLPEYEFNGAEIEELNELSYLVRYKIHAVDNARKYRSDFVGCTKVDFNGKLITKLEIISAGSNLDIGHLITRNREIFPDFKL